MPLILLNQFSLIPSRTSSSLNIVNPLSFFKDKTLILDRILGDHAYIHDVVQIKWFIGFLGYLSPNSSPTLLECSWERNFHLLHGFLVKGLLYYWFPIIKSVFAGALVSSCVFNCPL